MAAVAAVVAAAPKAWIRQELYNYGSPHDPQIINQSINQFSGLIICFRHLVHSTISARSVRQMHNAETALIANSLHIVHLRGYQSAFLECIS